MEGMTDLQFHAYLRLLLNRLESIRDENDMARREENLNRLIGIIKESIAD